MIDMHTHILPGVDDGSNDMDVSMEMIAYAVAHGVDEILLTPHGNIMGMYENSDISMLEMRYERLQEEVKRQQIPVKLHLGMEVFGTQDIDVKIKRRQVLKIGDSRYMLVEFPFGADADYMFFVLEQIQSQGLRPIIAHPERYTLVQRVPGIVYEWNRRGYGAQINKGSLAGEFGRREKYTAELLLESNLVQLIASDCHDCEYRKSGLSHVYEYISERYTEGYAELLMEINPRRILEDKTLLIINPRRI